LSYHVTTLDCPDDNGLLDFVEGRDARAEVAAHVEGCPACRDLVAHARLELGALPPADWGRYEILGEVAHGGIGRILRARDRNLGRDVALKVPLDARDRARFAREAQVTARLQHPAIVPLYEAGTSQDGAPFYAMKLVAGRSLKQVIADGPSGLALLPNVLAVAEALAYAHSQGVIHRDLKPANILLGEFGETVVIDWGLARDLAADAADAGGGAILGTPSYMPPEQARGEPVDERADVYALGALLYHVLAGAPPYSGSAASILAELHERPPAPVEQRQPSTPPELAAIVRKAMARAPADRYRTARELAEDLGRYLTGQLVSSHDYSTALLLRRWLARHRPAVVSVALLLVGSLAATWISVLRIDEARRVAEARRDALILAQAATFAASDPTTALAWLKLYPPGARDWRRAGSLLGELESARVARALFRQVRDVEPAPAGGWMAIAADDGAVVLWDAETGRTRALPRPDEPVQLVRFAPDGRTLAGLGDRALWLWDLASGARRLRWRADAPLAWRPEFLRFAPDGHALAAVTGPDVLVWDVTGGAPRRLVGDAGPIEGIGFTPDGRALATVGLHGAVMLWQVDSGAGRRLGNHEAECDALSVSPDGLWVASTGSDNDVRLWRTDGSEARVLHGHTRRVYAVGFLPDGRPVSVAYDQTVRIWPLDGGAAEVLNAGSRTAFTGLRSLAVAPDGRRLAAAGRDALIYVWDPAAGGLEALAGAGGSGEVLAFSGDGRWLVSLSADDTWRVWDMRHALPGALPTARADVTAAVFSADGAWLAVAAGAAIQLCARDGWRCRELDDHGAAVTALAFAPDGRWLASGDARGRIRVTSVAGPEGRDVTGHEGRVLALSWAPDGRSFASASDDRTVRVWDRAGAGRVVARQADDLGYVAASPDGRWLAAGGADHTTIALTDLVTGATRALEGHAQWVQALAFSADSRFLASTAVTEPSARLWDVATGGSRTLPHLNAQFGALLRFSPDGSQLAGSGQGGVVKLWDTGTGALRELDGPMVQLRVAAFSPDGRLLAAGGDDGAVRVWDVASGASRVLRANHGVVTALAFAPDGRSLVSGGQDGRAIVWPVDDVGPLVGDARALGARMAELSTVVLGHDDRALTLLGP
jgi:WD40 repeat protein